MHSLSPCLSLVQAHRVHHPGACLLCVLRGGRGHSSMACHYEHYHQELTTRCGMRSDWWMLLRWFQIALDQTLRTEDACFLQVHIVLLPPCGWWSSWYLFWGKMGNPGQGDGASGILQQANLAGVVDLDCFAISCLIQPKLVEERGGS